MRFCSHYSQHDTIPNNSQLAETTEFSLRPRCSISFVVMLIIYNCWICSIFRNTFLLLLVLYLISKIEKQLLIQSTTYDWCRWRQQIFFHPWDCMQMQWYDKHHITTNQTRNTTVLFIMKNEHIFLLSDCRYQFSKAFDTRLFCLFVCHVLYIYFGFFSIFTQNKYIFFLPSTFNIKTKTILSRFLWKNWIEKKFKTDSQSHPSQNVTTTKCNL